MVQSSPVVVEIVMHVVCDDPTSPTNASKPPVFNPAQVTLCRRPEFTMK
jgi:hypothetical protein